MSSELYDVIGDFEDLDLRTEEVAALAFVTWDSFENGGFKVEKEDYVPALRALYYKTLDYEKQFKAAMEKLMTSYQEHNKEAGAAG